MRSLASLALICTLGGCSTPTAVKDTLWNWSMLGLPADATPTLRCQDVDLLVGGEPTADCLGQISGQRPLVVFMHGCSGPNHQYMQFFRKLGYVVVAPNSLMRDRRPACPTNLQVVALRIEEVELILERTKAWPWVDRSRLVLAGYSEGGVTTALYSGAEFRAKIIMGWTCISPNPSWAGIRGRAPALALLGSADHWYVNTVNAGDCERDMYWLQNSRSVVFPGVGHDVLLETSSREESERLVKDFLQAALKQ